MKGDTDAITYNHLLDGKKDLVKDPVVSKRIHQVKRRNGLHYYKQTRLYIPDGTLRKELLHDYHDTPLAGHKGVVPTLAALKKQYF